MEEETEKQLLSFVKKAGSEIFTKDYNPELEETLGVIVSKLLKWNGVAIAKAAYMAFEDANFHTLNKEFASLLRKHKIEVEI